MANMNEIERALAEPIDKSLIKRRKVQGDKVASYITARTVMNRLDSVVGPSGWYDTYRPIAGGVECTLFIKFGDEWIGKTDAAEETKIEPVKGAYSDALKRAACKWGIARELYQEGTALDDDEPPTPSAPASHPKPERPVTRAERSTADEPELRDAVKETPAAAQEAASMPVKHWYKDGTTRKNFEVSLGNIKKSLNLTPEQVARILGFPENAKKEDMELVMQKFDNPGEALSFIREQAKQIA